MITAAVAVLATKVMFTGIMAFVPSKAEPGLIRVLAPNARVPEFGEPVPSHVNYVMFRLEDLASDDPRISRQPDFVFENEDAEIVLGVCLIKGEHLQVGPFSSLTTAPDIKNGLPASMFQCCRDPLDTKPVDLDTDLLLKTPDAARVGLRIDLAHGELADEPASIDPAVSNVIDSKKSCAALTRLVTATLPVQGTLAELKIASTPFAGSVQQLPLLLARKTADNDLRVLIGNEPFADLVITSDFLVSPYTVHTNAHLNSHAAAHMRILNRLTEGQAPILRPEIIPADKCVDGLSTFTSNGGTGKPDGCNPTGMRPADPPDFKARTRTRKE